MPGLKGLESTLGKLEKLAAARQKPATLDYRLRVVNSREEYERLPLPPVVTHQGSLRLRRGADLGLYESPGPTVLPVNVSPKQYGFINSTADITTFCAGRGSGKSDVGAKALCLRAKPGLTYCIAAPNYGMLHDSTRKTFDRVCQQLGMYVEGAYVETPRPHTTLRNGAKVILRSCDDPENLRGFEVSGLWMDEVQGTDEEAFDNLLMCLRENAVLGWTVATFTPGSPDHWTSKRLVLTDNPGVKCFTAGLNDNPFLDPKIYARAVRDLASSPMRFRREIMGEMVWLEGAEWDASYFQDCEFDEWPDPSRGGIKVISLDSSKGRGTKTGDYSCFTLLWFVDGLMYVDFDMRNDRNSTVISETGVELFATWKPHYFVVEDEMGQDVLIADMHRIADERGIPMAITPMGSDKISKQVRIRRLTPYVSRKMIRFKSNSQGAKLGREQMMAFPIPDAHDDAPDSCFVAGTMITTARGQVPIEQVTTDDKVLTRQGFFPVSWCGPTGESKVIEVALKCGVSIMGTPKHPMFDGIGFTPLSNASELYLCPASTSPASLSRSSLMASPSAAIRCRSIGHIGCTTARTPGTAETASDACTKKSGRPHTARYRTGTKFTTRIETASVTPLRISRASRKRSTTRNTMTTAVREPSFRTRHVRQPRNGTHRPRATHGTSSMARTVRPIFRLSPFSVGFAVRTTRRYARSVPSSAARTAARSSIVGSEAAATRRRRLANTVIGSTRERKTTSSVTARRYANSVSRWRPIKLHASPVVRMSERPGRVLVYNLSVDGPHEYFANGILVHNCEYAVRMVVKACTGMVAEPTACYTNALGQVTGTAL